METLSDNILLSYKGKIDSIVIDKLVSETLVNISNNSLKNKIIHILVECIQNIYHHSENNILPTKQLNNNTVSIYYDNQSYYIVCSNIVSLDRTKHISQIIKAINSRDISEVKKIYQTKLQDNKFSDKGTAGLGFYDITKRCKNKLEYNFEKLDNNFFKYTLRVKIDF